MVDDQGNARKAAGRALLASASEAFHMSLALRDATGTLWDTFFGVLDAAVLRLGLITTGAAPGPQTPSPG